MEISNAIDLKNITVRLDDNTILDNISWQVPVRQHNFILGANGAGKTTLVKTMMGFTWPIFGAEVCILGNTYGHTNLLELRRRIALVSPFMHQYTSTGNWTALEIVLTGIDGTLGLFRKVTDAENEHAINTMQMLDCAHTANRSVNLLSSGEQLKVLICRALMTKPELMILDEPCVHLDMKGREYLLESIDNFAKLPNAPTIIFITQRIEDIIPVFKHGIILRHGQIIARGSRDELLREDILRETFGMVIKLQQSKSGRFWPVID
ncbi:MAG: ATP-binding cassette domain-containing protein [Victivallaceae bacterium]|nr:ATP-binding cassette domain-containing protein [Victivallaceae bacterium]MDD4318668.1 ATP-binding cassette domain-containing protein [Victivallaceae bacterium]NLK83920.1 ATP-binding cassette domain-containing protein [Lentisphaerota bacterium]